MNKVDRNAPGPKAATESGPSNAPERVGDLLGGVFRKLGLSREIARQSALGRWSEVVGSRIAEVSRATGISQGVLFVEVDSSAWLNELSLMRHELLRRLNAGQRDGKVERIVFRLMERKREGGRTGPGADTR